MLSVCSLFFIFAYLILSFICFDCMLFVLMFCLCFCCVLISAFVWKSLFTYIKVRMHSENVQIFSKEEITFCVRTELLVRWNLIVYLYLSDITVSRVSPVRFCKTSPRKRYLHGIKDIFPGLHFIQVILAGYNFFIFKTSIFYRATFSLGLFPLL